MFGKSKIKALVIITALGIGSGVYGSGNQTVIVGDQKKAEAQLSQFCENNIPSGTAIKHKEKKETLANLDETIKISGSVYYGFSSNFDNKEGPIHGREFVRRFMLEKVDKAVSKSIIRVKEKLAREMKGVDHLKVENIIRNSIVIEEVKIKGTIVGSADPMGASKGDNTNLAFLRAQEVSNILGGSLLSYLTDNFAWDKNSKISADVNPRGGMITHGTQVKNAIDRLKDLGFFLNYDKISRLRDKDELKKFDQAMEHLKATDRRNFEEIKGILSPLRQVEIHVEIEIKASVEGTEVVLLIPAKQPQKFVTDPPPPPRKDPTFIQNRREIFHKSQKIMKDQWKEVRRKNMPRSYDGKAAFAVK